MGKKTVRSKVDFAITKGGPIRKWGVVGVGNFRAAGILFRYQIPCMIFLGHSRNIFYGLIGVYEFFSFNFPLQLREYFFVTSPPPPISFLMVRPYGR